MVGNSNDTSCISPCLKLFSWIILIVPPAGSSPELPQTLHTQNYKNNHTMTIRLTGLLELTTLISITSVLLFNFCSFKGQMRAFFMRVVVEKDIVMWGKASWIMTPALGKTPPLRQARRSLTTRRDTELLITSVRPRLEFRGACPPFVMPMIKMCHPALDPHHMGGNWWRHWQALWILMRLSLFL